MLYYSTHVLQLFGAVTKIPIPVIKHFGKWVGAYIFKDKC